jgi:dGTPase
LLRGNGGFEHNRQCIRVVDLLESRYPQFPGLNLTFELREGILKHHSQYDTPVLPRDTWGFEDLTGHPNPPLECQIVNVSDEIAYNCHDVDDGLSSGILVEGQLNEVKLWAGHYDHVKGSFGEADEQMRRHIMVRYLINLLVTDLIENSMKTISHEKPQSVEDIRSSNIFMIRFSDEIAKKNGRLKLFLYHNMYRHHRMVRMAEKAKLIVTELYKEYMRNVDVLPAHVKARIDKELRHVVVADYIAGMTDRFAAAEYKKLVDPFEKV